MKKQSKKSPLWTFRGLLLAALSGLSTAAFAQGVDVCSGTPYTIASTVDASGASTYQWLENGQLISGASAATYVVPSSKTAGLYTYIRQAKSADCGEWQSSNEFMVTVFNCSFTAGAETGATATFVDPRDGKSYKTVVLPDGKTWFAQNLNYTKDLACNAYAYEANGKQFTSTVNGVPAVGSYWCPSADGVVASGDEAACKVYGALYTWETAMMVDGKYADEAKTSSAWNESWVSGNYYAPGTAPANAANADKNNARGGTSAKGGGRGICPMGWHVPTELEWATMLDAVDGAGTGTAFRYQQTEDTCGTDAALKLRNSSWSDTDIGDGAWTNLAYVGTDTYGFSAIPAGWRDAQRLYFMQRWLGFSAWSSTVCDPSTSWTRRIWCLNIYMWRNHWVRAHGQSVRCVRN
jgi:uncharacterized protein (TIGR02145 family)